MSIQGFIDTGGFINSLGVALSGLSDVRARAQQRRHQEGAINNIQLAISAAADLGYFDQPQRTQIVQPPLPNFVGLLDQGLDSSDNQLRQLLQKLRLERELGGGSALPNFSNNDSFSGLNGSLGTFDFGQQRAFDILGGGFSNEPDTRLRNALSPITDIF